MLIVDLGTGLHHLIDPRRGHDLLAVEPSPVEQKLTEFRKVAALIGSAAAGLVVTGRRLLPGSRRDPHRLIEHLVGKGREALAGRSLKQGAERCHPGSAIAPRSA